MNTMKKSGKLLIVDDEEIALQNLERVMTKEGYEVITTQSGTEALTIIDTHDFDILLTDLRMEKVDGMQLLKACREQHPDSEVIMITGYATAESAVEAMKQGAFYYIAKPFRLDEVRKVVSEAMEKIHLRLENRQLREQVDAYQGKQKIITQDNSMRRLLDLARQIAPTDCNVLIAGESGTGKELFAHYIHENSTRSNGPYVAVNCGAFSRDLLANELFGHEKDAFTGAMTPKKGLIEAASGGTLFLDEVTEMSSDMQVKLLRVLQEREVLRLGSVEPIKVDIRVIAATNRNISEAIKNGLLRQDLYFRLNVVGLNIPSLAERKGDIPLLVRNFLLKYTAQMKKEVDGISPEALEKLMNYSYPGNIRELENIIERGTAITTGNVIDVPSLPEELREASVMRYQNKGDRIPTLEEQEREYIHWVLDKVGGNQTEAAQALGINRSSLWRKLKSYQSEDNSTPS